MSRTFLEGKVEGSALAGWYQQPDGSAKLTPSGARKVSAFVPAGWSGGTLRITGWVGHTIGGWFDGPAPQRFEFDYVYVWQPEK